MMDVRTLTYVRMCVLYMCAFVFTCSLCLHVRACACMLTSIEQGTHFASNAWIQCGRQSSRVVVTHVQFRLPWTPCAEETSKLSTISGQRSSIGFLVLVRARPLAASRLS